MKPEGMLHSSFYIKNKEHKDSDYEMYCSWISHMRYAYYVNLCMDVMKMSLSFTYEIGYNFFVFSRSYISASSICILEIALRLFWQLSSF